MERFTTSTTAQQLLRRAWSSAYYRQPAHHLRLLLAALAEIGTDRKVYRRFGEEALESQDAARLTEAIGALQSEIARRQAAQAQARQQLPLLYRAAA